MRCQSIQRAKVQNALDDMAGNSRPISVYRLGEMLMQSCGQSGSALRGKAGARWNAHTELRTKRQRSARVVIYRHRPISEALPASPACHRTSPRRGTAVRPRCSSWPHHRGRTRPTLSPQPACMLVHVNLDSTPSLPDLPLWVAVLYQCTRGEALISTFATMSGGAGESLSWVGGFVFEGAGIRAIRTESSLPPNQSSEFSNPQPGTLRARALPGGAAACRRCGGRPGWRR
jgi:hypothetical protein